MTGSRVVAAPPSCGRWQSEGGGGGGEGGEGRGGEGREGYCACK